MKEIEPWGVNVPFLLLGLAYWCAGGVSLFEGLAFHPLFMMIGTYSIYFGMFQRLFFPARNYLPLHLASLVLLAVPVYPLQAFASVSLVGVEVWGVKDIRSYGTRFPVNWLVLSSPVASVVAWLLYPLDVWVLVVPLLLYLLGVNVGVFSATLGLKPKFGWRQFPVLDMVVLTGVLPSLFPALVVAYTVWLFLGTRRFKFNLTALLSLLTPVVASISSLSLGEEIHAFALGMMAPFFFSCITYSTSRYNYGRTVPVPVLLLSSYLLRSFDLWFSSLLFILSTLYFIYMTKDNFTLTTVRSGMASKYVRPPH
ncbi:hypothetical protein IC006_0556 [Sulfuracidifex tepidarius]|uniref:Uncharacterized protein n=1 Tax=Sulfuracidifex tepidarius TaxID=1294262 RepID=A0A510DSX9_9CREN|nr:hypothetical protein [Sulfuracidifex tepidarius]BBG23272.1 hypothetical protein IC006_0556 [Sulfuracidifex tepidarius]